MTGSEKRAKHWETECQITESRLDAELFEIRKQVAELYQAAHYHTPAGIRQRQLISGYCRFVGALTKSLTR